MINKLYLVKFILFFILTITVKTNLMSQVLLTNPKNLNYKIIDTIDIDIYTRDLKIEWLNDTIIINKRDDNYAIDTTKSSRYTDLIEASAQNCYSYALEKYFENDSTYSQNLFNKSVTIPGSSLMTIIDKHFNLINEFSIKNKKEFMKSLTNKTLIGLVDKEGRIIHMIYYNKGVFYTKNGMFPPNKFTNIRKFLKTKYRYTNKLRTYKFSGGHS